MVEFDPEMLTGLAIGSVMMLLIFMPMFCCQVSNEEYQDLMHKMQKRKEKAEAEQGWKHSNKK